MFNHPIIPIIRAMTSWRGFHPDRQTVADPGNPRPRNHLRLEKYSGSKASRSAGITCPQKRAQKTMAFHPDLWMVTKYEVY